MSRYVGGQVTFILPRCSMQDNDTGPLRNFCIPNAKVTNTCDDRLLGVRYSKPNTINFRHLYDITRVLITFVTYNANESRF